MFEFPDFHDPCALIAWLGTSTGVNAILGVILSFALERVPWWEKFKHWQKRILVGLICLLIPVSALLFSVIFCGGIPDFHALWSAIVTGGSAFVTSQIAHTRVLIRNKK